ncbi:F-box/LRR-repeat protein fbxl-1-like [Ptychodera flava]|uniref:F-box/LRR-repeat protein fbxl-1-like n=1 Tax=Ptychodera flava TaxID=63121 RepID=UPI00396A4F1C
MSENKKNADNGIKCRKGKRKQGGSTDAESRLSKRLGYMLRYGAEKEGLRVSNTGFVDLRELLKLPLFTQHTETEVLNEIKHSKSTRGNKRFEFRREYDGQILVRALYGRKMERNPYHEGSKVVRLLELCFKHICKNIEDYDLEDFPDEFLVSSIIHKLKREKRLSNNTMRSALGNVLESLDLEGVYLTEKSLKIIAARCPNLKHLRLKDCGYLINDQIFSQLIKKLPLIEKIHLHGCSQLTGKSLTALRKHVPRIIGVNVACIRNFTQQDILDFINGCPDLIYLNILECGLEMSDEFCLKLADAWIGWNIRIIYQ